VLHRRGEGAPRWTRADDLPDGPIDFMLAGDLDRLLAAQDQLSQLDDARLLQEVVAFGSDSRLNHVLRWSGGAFKVVEASLVRDVGLRTDAEVTPPLAKLFANVDGSRTLEEVLRKTAVEESAQTEALAVVRQLVAYGFLQFV